MKLRLIKTLFVALLLWTLPVQAQQVVRSIQIEGDKRIEETTIRSYLGIQEGQSVNRALLDQGLKNLFATGLFADVSLRQRGDDLIVQVVENPVINRVAFEGNDDLKDDELALETHLKSRQIYTRTKVKSDVERLHQIYRRNGRFSARIEPKIIKLEQNRVDLVFEIDEGDVTKVKAIRFVGNDHYADARLREILSTKEAAWYRFISNSDRYDPDRLAFDQELIRQFYLSEGYADFNVVSAVAELSQDRSGFYITITVDEGNRYKLGNVGLTNHIDDLDTQSLEPYIELTKGDWYSSTKVQSTIGKLTDALGDLQYAFVDVHPKIDRHYEEGTIDLSFVVDEAPRAFVERINIIGNVRTLDKVIRREILLSEGDPFNRSKLSRSEQAVRDLDFFETVDFKIRPGSAPDLTVIDVVVTEKSTGELSLGAGFSTSDGVIGDVSFTERNLLGKGQLIKTGAALSADRTRFDVSFVEPYFLDRDVSAGVNLYNVETDDDDTRRYDEKDTGGTLFVNYPLSERWRQTLKYRLNRSEISDLPTDVTRFLLSQEGERTTSAVSQRLTYDNRDSKLYPTDGYNFWLETEVAGLGFDSKHVSAVTGASYYYPVMDNVVFNLLGETGGITGYGDEDVEVSERFSLGGPKTLRGFERYGVGPRDLLGDDSVGGNLFYRGTAQMSFPLGLPESAGVKGYIFSDVGSLWNSDENYDEVVDEHAVRASAGVGVSWRSPFGPIGFYYAHPFMKEDYDELKEFELNFGTTF